MVRIGRERQGNGQNRERERQGNGQNREREAVKWSE